MQTSIDHFTKLMRYNKTTGTTLIDLLVILAILSIFFMVLLPAVQASREIARTSNCQSNLKKLSNAMLELQATHGAFPAHGWGIFWMPDPDMGISLKQPGGWGYQVLPFLGEQKLYLKGAGKSYSEKCKANRIRVETPLAVWNCPTRRPAKAYPVPQTVMINQIAQPYWCDLLKSSIRNDYVVNAGDRKSMFGYGPKPIGTDIIATYESHEFPDFSKMQNGISWPQSQVTLRDIPDGTSNTYMIGEKSVDPSLMLKGISFGDDQSPYSGDDLDCVRWAERDSQPARDTFGSDLHYRFGSSHPEGFNMSFCDGAILNLSYKIDMTIHQQLANRRDGSGTVRPN